MESHIRPQPAVAFVPAPLRRGPAPQAPRRPATRVLPLLLCALATGGLLWLSYFPADCGWLAWFALIPLLALVRTTARPWLVYLCAMAGGLAFYGPALQWLRVADPRMYFTWIFLAFYCALYFPFVLFFVRFLDRRAGLPLALTLPVAWTALEFFRCSFCTGFSYYLLGHTQHDCLPVLQIADLTGAYGVSFLVAAVNAVLFEALYRGEWFRARFVGPDAPAPRARAFLLAQAGVIAAVLAAAVGYGEWRLSEDAFTPGPRIALIQGNVPQQIRNDPKAGVRMTNHFLALGDLASLQKAALIVWPETSFPYGWVDASGLDAAGRKAADIPEDWEDLQKQKLNVGSRWNTSLLLGTDAYTPQADGPTLIANSALLFDRAGQLTGRYDKMHCVVFGEYVPLRDWLPWMRYFAPYDFDYSVTPGRETTHFQMDDGQGRRFSFGVAICYEDTDPDRVRPYGGGDGQPPVDFLLNISNDGWFDGTSEHDEHLAICRFRAVECRRSVGRAVNMGISALIDGNGRVLAPQPVAGTEWDDARVRQAIQKTDDDLFPTDHKAAVWLASPSQGGAGLPTARWAEYKKVSGILLADVPIDHRVSLYALWGDWMPWVCWGLLGVAVVLAFVRGRRRPRAAR